MDISSVTPLILAAPAPLPATAAPASYLDTVASLTAADPAPSVPAAPTAAAGEDAAYVALPTLPVDLTPDLTAADAAAQVEQIFQAQQALMAAMSSGGMDTALALSGLPPGATALLLGAGWVQPMPGTPRADPSDALWAFRFPFRREDVPAVTSANPAGPPKDKEPGAPLTAYGPQGETEPMPGQPGGVTLDILD